MADNTTQSPQKPAEKGKKLFAGKRNRKWIALCLLAVAAVAGGTVLLNRAKARTDNTETTYTTAAVEKRSITNSLTGSGTLEPADSYTVTTLVSGEVLSDTFEEFAKPLMEKLNWPTILCNSLEVAESGEITGFRMRCPQSKLTTVRALQSMGYETIAAGDSHNDLAMIRASKAGFLFRSTEAIKAENPDLPAYERFDDLLSAIRAAL